MLQCDPEEGDEVEPVGLSGPLAPLNGLTGRVVACQGGQCAVAFPPPHGQRSVPVRSLRLAQVGEAWDPDDDPLPPPRPAAQPPPLATPPRPPQQRQGAAGEDGELARAQRELAARAGALRSPAPDAAQLPRAPQAPQAALSPACTAARAPAAPGAPCVPRSRRGAAGLLLLAAALIGLLHFAASNAGAPPRARRPAAKDRPAPRGGAGAGGPQPQSRGGGAAARRLLQLPAGGAGPTQQLVDELADWAVSQRFANASATHSEGGGTLRDFACVRLRAGELLRDEEKADTVGWRDDGTGSRDSDHMTDCFGAMAKLTVRAAAAVRGGLILVTGDSDDVVLSQNSWRFLDRKVGTLRRSLSDVAGEGLCGPDGAPGEVLRRAPERAAAAARDPAVCRQAEWETCKRARVLLSFGGAADEAGWAPHGSGFSSCRAIIAKAKRRPRGSLPAPDAPAPPQQQPAGPAAPAGAAKPQKRSMLKRMADHMAAVVLGTAGEKGQETDGVLRRDVGCVTLRALDLAASAGEAGNLSWVATADGGRQSQYLSSCFAAAVNVSRALIPFETIFFVDDIEEEGPAGADSGPQRRWLREAVATVRHNVSSRHSDPCNERGRSQLRRAAPEGSSLRELFRSRGLCRLAEAYVCRQARGAVLFGRPDKADELGGRVLRDCAAVERAAQRLRLQATQGTPAV
eukprot:TRINITY_DN13112_c0_g1_i1.p1 TRINITY_DN13112_c0_g1~~TRINITY_DN13112_c0_g1_i1.p1  ORF type:complete len:708 (+),score=212.06 TRINITY_DN13112_c0_g1_i1:66-2126(+)